MSAPWWEAHKLVTASPTSWAGPGSRWAGSSCSCWLAVRPLQSSGAHMRHPRASCRGLCRGFGSGRDGLGFGVGRGRGGPTAGNRPPDDLLFDARNGSNLLDDKATAEHGQVVETELDQTSEFFFDRARHGRGTGVLEPLADALIAVREKLGRLINRATQDLRTTFALQELVGVLRIGKRFERRDLDVDLFREEHLDRAVRGLLAGLIAVKEQNNRLAQATQDNGVLACQGGPKRRDGVGDSRLMARDRVRVPLGDDRDALLLDASRCLEEAVKRAGLIEDPGLRRVQ